MPNKCFQLILCDKERSAQSMCPANSSPLFLDDTHGRFALAEYIINERDTCGLEIKDGYENAIRYIIIQGDPVKVNAFIDYAIVVEWEIV